MPDQKDVENIGGTLRLGAYPCVLDEHSRSCALYGKTEISERHRHRYEVNNDYREVLEKAGLHLAGLSPDKRIVEMIISELRLIRNSNPGRIVRIRCLRALSKRRQSIRNRNEAKGRIR